MTKDFSDYYPTITVIQNMAPSISGITDVYVPGEVAIGGQLMGILGLTYPTTGPLF